MLQLLINLIFSRWHIRSSFSLTCIAFSLKRSPRGTIPETNTSFLFVLSAFAKSAIFSAIVCTESVPPKSLVPQCSIIVLYTNNIQIATINNLGTLVTHLSGDVHNMFNRDHL